MRATRRVFVGVAGTSAVWALAGCSSRSASPCRAVPPRRPHPSRREIVIPLMGVGQTAAAVVNLVGDLQTPLAVTRLDEMRVVAVSRICTHMQCTVALPASVGGTLDCPCHGSRFQISGQVVNGPAERPLGMFSARIQDDQVVISTNV